MTVALRTCNDLFPSSDLAYNTGNAGGIVKYRTNATNLATEMAVLAEALGMDHVRVRSSIYAKALTLRSQSDLPLDQLTASLMNGVADYLAACALREQRPSFNKAIKEAAQRIPGSSPMAD